jgi:hypothetical protein
MKKMRAMYYKPGWLASKPAIQFIIPDEVDLIDELARYGVDYTHMEIGRYRFPLGEASSGIMALLEYFEKAFENPDEAVITIPTSVFAYIVQEIYDAGACYIGFENEPRFDDIHKGICEEAVREAKLQKEDDEEVYTVNEYIEEKKRRDKIHDRSEG